MYIEYLQTPHPSLRAGTERTAFFEAAGLTEAARYVQDAPDYDTAAREVTAHVQATVRSSLRYPAGEFATAQSGSVFDTLRSGQVTDCAGYTAVGSECLEVAGIEHYVAYANGHWLMLLPSEQRRRLHTVDMLSPYLSQDATNALRRGSVSSLMADTLNPSVRRGVAMLDTLELTAPLGVQIEALENDHPWLAAGNTRMPRVCLTPEQERSRYLARHSIIMSTYTPALGRSIMHHHADFMTAVRSHDLDTAVTNVLAMRGLYPEIDARDSHREIRQLVGDLCLVGHFDHAKAVTNAYCGSFTASNDARLKGLEGDLLRQISRVSKDTDAAHSSARAYKEALSRTSKAGSREMYAGRIATMGNLANIA